jgi:two-component system chemotaxis sensor kinase CheA
MEHVADIESALLELEGNTGDPELLNRIFRAAHSIKGGSGTFELVDVTRFTHALESLLDPLRQGTMLFNESLANLLFRATDDDGRGLNTERIRQKGLEVGLIRPGENYSEE